jgi:hypothetical protein
MFPEMKEKTPIVTIAASSLLIAWDFRFARTGFLRIDAIIAKRQ